MSKAKPAKPQIEWSKRCKRHSTPYSDRRTWASKCGRYKVSEVDIKLGKYNDERGNFLGYPIFYLAYVLHGVEDDWRELSEHRRLSAAKKQCEYYARYGCVKPRRTKEAKAVQRVKAKRKARKEEHEI